MKIDLETILAAAKAVSDKRRISSMREIIGNGVILTQGEELTKDSSDEDILRLLPKDNL